MFVDLSQFRQLSEHGVDVAVAGAGPAGIALACELSARGKSVLLLEAGGLDYPSEQENDPYIGRVASRPYPLSGSRLRYFGGSSNHWGGWVRPLDREDFQVNAGIPYSGWPIGYDELVPYYGDAQQLCEVPDNQYDPSKIANLNDLNLLNFDEESEFRNSIFRFSPPTKFGQRYKQDVAQLKNIFCVLHTQLLYISFRESGSSSFVCLDRARERVEVNARHFVLAMGGIENARALLCSRAVNDNRVFENDWIGRCFADHFAFDAGLILSKPEINYDRSSINGADLMARIAPSRRLLNEHGVGNLMLELTPSSEREILSANYFQNPAIFKNANRGWLYNLRLVCGQRPNRDSRVKLNAERDANGMPRVELCWNIADQDFENAFLCVRKFAMYLGGTSQGRVKVELTEAPSRDTILGVGMHHIGTTRMARSEVDGVVDRNCKVFGTTDLYIAGSSVFPTSGYSNPTLTIVALAVRLARHLAKKT
jgi:choline dehydrogenase-like flavoprotein